MVVQLLLVLLKLEFCLVGELVQLLSILLAEERFYTQDINFYSG